MRRAFWFCGSGERREWLLCRLGEREGLPSLGYLSGVVLPLWREAVKEAAFRSYLADAARLICGNTAGIGGGQVLTRRWADMVRSPRAGDGPSGKEVVGAVLAALEDRAGIRITDG